MSNTSPYGYSGNNEGQPQSAYGQPSHNPQHPQANTPPQSNVPPQSGPYNHQTQPNQTAPVSNIPTNLKLETSFAWMYFLGTLGAHKFYMKQTKVAWIYPVIFLAIAILQSAGGFLGLIAFLALIVMYVNFYVDIRTMREQLERSERGEKFTAKTQIELFKRVIFNK